MFAEVIQETQDLNVHVIIVDYESKDIDIEAVFKRSTIQWYTLVRIPGEQGFQRAVALQRGAEVVTDPHSILFMCDLNLKIPPNLISIIRKVSSFTVLVLYFLATHCLFNCVDLQFNSFVPRPRFPVILLHQLTYI